MGLLRKCSWIAPFCNSSIDLHELLWIGLSTTLTIIIITTVTIITMTTVTSEWTYWGSTLIQWELGSQYGESTHQDSQICPSSTKSEWLPEHHHLHLFCNFRIVIINIRVVSYLLPPSWAWQRCRHREEQQSHQEPPVTRQKQRSIGKETKRSLQGGTSEISVRTMHCRFVMIFYQNYLNWPNKLVFELAKYCGSKMEPKPHFPTMFLGQSIYLYI